MKTVKTFVNGEEHNLEVEPRELLVHFLRDRLNLTGIHVGRKSKGSRIAYRDTIM